MILKQLFLYFFIAVCFLSCVPPKLFSELESEKNICSNERYGLLSENEKLTVENTELKANLERAEEARERTEDNCRANAEELNSLKSTYNQLDKRYNELYAQHESFISGSETETKKLIGQLDNTQRDLYKREDQLNQLSLTLEKEQNQLNMLKSELEDKNSRLIELQRALSRKDSAVDALKQKVTAALLGFENQGLSITKKNGKVYISLEEKLLFGSGSTQVDLRGISALKKLAVVLGQNPDINITIEGHTDDVPVIPGAKFEDNWDLSTQRANAIIRILLDGTRIKPKRLISSGRSEYMPIDNAKTTQARQKNRRTEIILTPNLDELLNILESR